MANTYVTLAGQVLHPLLPMEREIFYVGSERRMLSGGLRRAFRAAKNRFTYTTEEMTAAQLNAFIAAVVFSASLTLVDEQAISRTVVLVEMSAPLERSEPAVDGASTGTGNVYYTATVTLEDV